MTAPTIGLGETLPAPRLARARARSIIFSLSIKKAPVTFGACQPSIIRTLPSAPEFHRFGRDQKEKGDVLNKKGDVLNFPCTRGSRAFTAGREFHSTPKVRLILQLYPQRSKRTNCLTKNLDKEGGVASHKNLDEKK